MPQNDKFDLPEWARVPTTLIERGGYCREAPRFVDQLADPTRKTKIKFYKSNVYESTSKDEYGRGLAVGETTEAEALAELRKFLDDVMHVAHPDNPDAEEYSTIARDMIENLTYIGQPEFDEAVAGLKHRWLQFLQDNPDSKICVLVVKSENADTGQPKKIKSGSYILENILARLTNEEHQTIGDRLVTDTSQLDTSPDKTKIVLLDDWTLSGSQVCNMLDKILSDPLLHQYESSLEVNLLVSSKETISQGIKVNLKNYNDNEEDVHDVPVWSYFAAHQAQHRGSMMGQQGIVHITGRHSSTDRGFGNELLAMVEKGLADLPLPALVNVVRPYHPEMGRARFIRWFTRWHPIELKN